MFHLKLLLENFHHFNLLKLKLSFQAQWLKKYLGPMLRRSKYSNIKIMIFDDSTITLPHVVPLVRNFYNNPNKRQISSD